MIRKETIADCVHGGNDAKCRFATSLNKMESSLSHVCQPSRYKKLDISILAILSSYSVRLLIINYFSESCPWKRLENNGER